MIQVNSPDSLRGKAKELAYALGMRFYIRGDKLYQHPPGEEIIPRGNHNPVPHGPDDTIDKPKSEGKE